METRTIDGNWIFDDYEAFIREYFDCVYDFQMIYNGVTYWVHNITIRDKWRKMEPGWYFFTEDWKPLYRADSPEKLFDTPFFDGKSFKEKIKEIEIVD